MGQTHRRHDAGEARDGGAVRKRSTGDETSDGLAWREAGARPHPTELSARAEVDRNDGGDGKRGGRSSDKLGNDAVVRGRTRGWWCWVSGNMLST